MRAQRRAWKAAQQVLREEEVDCVPVDVEKIAARRAHIIRQDMPDEVSGMLIPLQETAQGRTWAIVVNARHAAVRQRFTIAHELAHLVIHGYTTPHADRGFKVRFRDTRSSDGSVIEEIEANQFAAELLMPKALLVRRLVEEDFEYVSTESQGSEQLARLAREFEVSEQALSIRLSSLLR